MVTEHPDALLVCSVCDTLVAYVSKEGAPERCGRCHADLRYQLALAKQNGLLPAKKKKLERAKVIQLFDRKGE
jgi:hypothetical protein